MQSFLRRLDGWHRIAFALSIAWIVIASASYFSALRTYYLLHDEPMFEHLSPLINWWLSFSGNLGLPMFETTMHEMHRTLFRDVQTTYISGWSFGFDPVGWLIFAAVPVSVLWAALLGARWIAAGFRKT